MQVVLNHFLQSNFLIKYFLTKILELEIMRINRFIASNYHSIIFKNNTIVDRQNSQNKNHLSTSTFSTQDLFFNQDTSKKQALQRAKEPIFVNVRKQENGTITFDRKQLSHEEVLSLREGDLENVEINWGSLELQSLSYIDVCILLR